MVYGHPVLIQDVGEELDPSLAAIFRMTGLDQERASMIQFGDKELSYNHNFRSRYTSSGNCGCAGRDGLGAQVNAD